MQVQRFTPTLTLARVFARSIIRARHLRASGGRRRRCASRCRSAPGVDPGRPFAGAAANLSVHEDLGLLVVGLGFGVSRAGAGRATRASPASARGPQRSGAGWARRARGCRKHAAAARSVANDAGSRGPFAGRMVIHSSSQSAPSSAVSPLAAACAECGSGCSCARVHRPWPCCAGRSQIQQVVLMQQASSAGAWRCFESA